MRGAPCLSCSTTCCELCIFWEHGEGKPGFAPPRKLEKQVCYRVCLSLPIQLYRNLWTSNDRMTPLAGVCMGVGVGVGGRGGCRRVCWGA